MRKLLTRAIAAGMLMAVFSVYGDTSNLVFYSDFENSVDGDAIATSADLNGATLAPLSLYDQIPYTGWSVGSLGNKSGSAFRQGAASMVAFIDLKKGANGLRATLSEPTTFKGLNATLFSCNFKANAGGKGLGHEIKGFDSKNTPVFSIIMGGILSPVPMLVTVNGTSFGIADRNASSATPLNFISLVIDSTGIDVTFTTGNTLVTTTNHVATLGGTNLTNFAVGLNGTVANSFDYDNFQVWSISRAPPPPRLDLYMFVP